MTVDCHRELTVSHIDLGFEMKDFLDNVRLYSQGCIIISRISARVRNILAAYNTDPELAYRQRLDKRIT